MKEQAAAQVYLETFGCQMNENDSSRILGFLKDIEYIRTMSPEAADLILLNTCSVRDKAEMKVYSMLGRFRSLKLQNPNLIIGVAGCVAQQEKERIFKRAPYVDLVFGPHNIHKLKQMLDEASAKSKVLATEFNSDIDPEEYGVSADESSVKAFVSIMRGCDNFCSYCIVPHTRGREASRLSTDIVNEVSALCRSGVKEVMLLGQNVNSYGRHGADVGFPELLRKVCSVDEIRRVRFVTSHPKDISEELISLFAEEPKLCRHLHLPVQSGSNAVLEAMGRGYTRERYAGLVSGIKTRYPDMAITTDIIAGFPGETDDDFEATLDLLMELRFDNIFAFKYSKRPGTKAVSLPDHVSEEVRAQRLDSVLKLQRAITDEINSGLLGKTVQVLVEGASRASANEFSGRTTCNRVVNFPASGVAAGEIAGVTITEVLSNSFRGVLTGY